MKIPKVVCKVWSRLLRVLGVEYKRDLVEANRYLQTAVHDLRETMHHQAKEK